MKDFIKIPNMKYYKRELLKYLSIHEYNQVKKISQENYNDLLLSCNYPKKAILKFWLRSYIFPSIAFYKALRCLGYKEDESFELIKNSLAKLGEKVSIVYKIVSYLPFSYQILRLIFMPKFYELIFPSPAWVSEVLENSNEKIVVYFYSCFFYKVCTDYDVQELTPCICNLDNVMFLGFSRIAEFKRTKIIGKGDAVCNNQLIRKK